MYERFKVFNTINSIHTKKERSAQLKKVKEAISELFFAGFNPYDKFKYSDQYIDDRYNTIRCFDDYLDFVKSVLKKTPTKFITIA
ncbi:hypothetical protein [Sphingobacterium bovistauri]|uniref:Uncharacterized protein n=1 Tax=Sphingobacterium bovistauri TaxID=2781959 RepID=A0ABS7Z7V7_9SPHI|nr:hypothetical protein [Sphingobacterium bovistauri]MCA5004784.1 hypothetical protein [Sphingobacterium bovistauri]